MIIAKSRLVRMLSAMGFVCILFAGLTLAQQTVTVSQKYNSNNTLVPTTRNAPVPPTYLEAAPTNPGSVSKVVFFKNDVPIATVTSLPFKVDLGELGQDTYTFRVRAYYPNDIVADSPEQKFTARSPKIYKMGTTILGVATSGPYRYGNHTQQIQQAVNAISADNGGTLFFPCTFGPRWPAPNTELDAYSIYVINDTIKIPRNVTLQGEAAGDKGPCQIWWYEPTYHPTTCGDQASGMNKPMFQVIGESSRVRFRDLALRSMSGGESCYYGREESLVAGDGTTGIEITTNGTGFPNPSPDGDVSDVIIENVTITQFTRGISAYSPGTYNIHNIKIRGVTSIWNHRQLYIDAPYAYDWDVQNFNAAAMGSGQGALEIIKSGVPPGYSEGRGDLRFVQLNCAGGPRRVAPPQPQLAPSTCITVNKHGGLYFKQVHGEGPSTTIIVNDTVGYDNDAPIVFEASVLFGEFNDASMKLYMIGSFAFGAPEEPQPSFWDSKMRFSGNGLLSKVVECGNLYIDRTDTDGNPNDLPEWGDWTMSFTHSERQRSSYYDVTNGYAFRKEPISCPVGRTDGIPDTNAIGGAYFDNGILPTEEDIPYTNPLTCPPLTVCYNLVSLMTTAFNSTADAGAVRIEGNWEVADEIKIPEYRLIVGVNGATITLTAANKSIFKRPLGGEMQSGQLVPTPASWIVLRDLTLKSTTQVGTTGISFKGTGHCTWIPNPNTPDDPDDRMPDPADLDCFLGAANDFYFSGLTIEGFDVGFYAGRFDNDLNEPSPEPMMDSIGLKNLKFVNNKTAVSMASSNASNWNIMNLEMQSNSATADGWMQENGGHQSFQTVKCSGVSAAAPMESCLRLDTTGAAVLGIRPGANVTNMVTLESPDSFYGRVTGHLLIRDSDLRSSVADRSMFYINGKAFITSVNNRYQYFAPGNHNEWQKTRVTYCGDDFGGGPDFPGLLDLDDDLNFGIDMPTRLKCKNPNAKQWSEAFKWGGQNNTDTPLVGNFYSDTQEDFVVYQRSAQSQFLIRKGGTPTVNEPPTKTINWGLPADIPVIGEFLDATPLSQIVAFRDGIWYAKDPNGVYPDNYYYWGTAGDKPFAGNFFKEAGNSAVQRDEIAIYRPGTKEVWIQNPRSPGVYKNIYLGGSAEKQVQTGDFLGVGYDQCAMFDDSTGTWYIVDANPQTPVVSTVTFGNPEDVAVTGRYLGIAQGYLDCTQLGVWRPSSEEFIVRDVSAACGGRGIAPAKRRAIRWGSNGDYNNVDHPNDIPLTINLQTPNGVLDRPVAYRPTTGYFEYSNQNGLWFVHDPF